jgi:hypothetical protein
MNLPLTPASLACKRCGSHAFYAQVTQTGDFLVLICIGCTEPVAFGVVKPPEDFLIEIRG